MIRTLLFLLLGLLSVSQSLAQKKSVAPASVGVANPGTGTFYYANRAEAPRAIVFEKGTVATAAFVANINQHFNIPAEFTFVETESNTDNLGMRHRFLQQHYQGMVVEGMGYRVHEKDGFVTSANGRAVRSVELDLQTTLNEQQAFQLAASYVQTTDPTVQPGRKLIVSKDFTYAPGSFAVAFQFDIDVSLIERWRISVDARTGNVVNKVSLVNSCHEVDKEETPPPPLPYTTATGTTSYYGTQTIRVEQVVNTNRMVGQTVHGGNIGTYDFRNGPLIILQYGFPYTVSEFYSLGNTFNSAYQRPAVSVQWAAEQAYEYYYRKHNRNSFDNRGGTITNYVHIDEKLDNAFWTGKLLAFGDGSQNNPPVELDVVSHELTHGVTQHEAALQYSFEPGALNESFSDIMAKAVEFDIFGDTATWQLARHFRAGGLRDMSNPNLKSQPDTYAGDLWYTGNGDSGGVHYNSGVQNFWFYLLCQGGSGVNDHQFNYTVQAIGMDAAVKIAYRNLTEYLTPTSDYLDSRIGSLLAAADLYGKNSTIYQQVDNAWDAVGVIDEPIVTSLELYDITATTVKIKGAMMPRADAATYHFEYGTTPGYGTSTPAYTYTDKIEGHITGLQSQTKYYLRLVATNENGSTNATAEFTTISLAPLVKIQQTVDVTETTATFYGQINPNSLATSFYFEYGTTPALGSVTASYPLADATEYLNISTPVTGLLPRKTYYYRLVATNASATARTTAVTFFTAVKPVITSFTPATAPVGTEVTIIGQGFNTTAENNRVNFGATRATVLQASPTTLTVTVPAGASLAPVSLLDAESGLAAESVQEFVPTFTGEFKKNSLSLAMGSGELIYHAQVYDMDGDGKPDIVTRNQMGFSVFLNVNQGGKINEESFVRNMFNSDFTPSRIVLVDLDGNGLKDVVAHYQMEWRVYQNLSVPGFIFFGAPVVLPIGNPSYLAFNDFDQDGHVDFAVGQGTTIKVFRNQNPKGIIAIENFVSQFSMPLPYSVYDLYSTDLNNDGKAEFVVSAYDETFVPVLKNNSSPGVFAFAESNVANLITVRLPDYVAQDLNQDGRRDILITGNTPGTMTILENTSSSPNITLRKTAFVPGNYEASLIQPGDINGDGIVDVLVGIRNGVFRVLINRVVAGEPITETSFDQFNDYGAADSDISWHASMTVNDLNGDGRPEVINTYSVSGYPFDGNRFEIYQNAVACIDPTGISINVSGNTATIVLPPNATREQFEMEYSYNNYTSWTTAQGTTINSLNSGYNYRLRVRAKCAFGFSDYRYIDFKSVCVDLNSFTISNVEIDNATLSASDLSSFEVQYSVAGENRWTTQYSSRITNLLPATTYDIRFRGRCTTQDPYVYKQFTTLCPKLSALSVSDITSTNATVRYTSAYSAKVIVEFSADNKNWSLLDASQPLRWLIPGRQYYVRAHFACTNSEFTYTSFTTLCTDVLKLGKVIITQTSAEINWSGLPGDTFVVTYNTLGGSTISIETTLTNIVLNELIAGTRYFVQINVQCAGQKYFVSTEFATLKGETTFSPNPTNGKITLYASRSLVGRRFEIYDSMGRTLASGELYDHTVDMSVFSYGVYTLKIEGENVMRIVKY